MGWCCPECEVDQIQVLGVDNNLKKRYLQIYMRSKERGDFTVRLPKRDRWDQIYEKIKMARHGYHEIRYRIRMKRSWGHWNLVEFNFQ